MKLREVSERDPTALQDVHRKLDVVRLSIRRDVDGRDCFAVDDDFDLSFSATDIIHRSRRVQVDGVPNNSPPG